VSTERAEIYQIYIYKYHLDRTKIKTVTIFLVIYLNKHDYDWEVVIGVDFGLLAFFSYRDFHFFEACLDFGRSPFS
jgi:hypothetical protein